MLFNSLTGKTLIQNTKKASSAWARFKGLMFEKKKKFDYGLIFELDSETKIGASIHMMFVFFPIDIIYLNSKKVVIDKKTVKPWILNYTPKQAAKYFIETPVGATKVKIWDKLDWK